jgi:hypothetical protein
VFGLKCLENGFVSQPQFWKGFCHPKSEQNPKIQAVFGD